jgi:hypothetical protein
MSWLHNIMSFFFYFILGLVGLLHFAYIACIHCSGVQFGFGKELE